MFPFCHVLTTKLFQTNRVIALEMAQSFALLGSKVTVLNRSSRLFESKYGDIEAAALLQEQLEKDGVTFISGAKVSMVETLKDETEDSSSFPLMKVHLKDEEVVCECLLVATGRAANVEDLGLEKVGVQYELGQGILVNDFGESVSNPNIYAIGDCCAGVPRLTHVAGEMAKLVVQNGLANDDWKLSRYVIGCERKL
jgi:pyruvate/2-oxoglutarate dehydrogenase complex dihydrolipoamide dehydrogenase (E3) component